MVTMKLKYLSVSLHIYNEKNIHYIKLADENSS